MIKFFRRIRQSLLTEKKFSKYFIYAIGEIILVVIGILIALQVSNWNQIRQENNKVKFYFKELIKKVDQQIPITETYIVRSDDLIKMQTRTLEILTSKNEEDIPELSQNIGSVAMTSRHPYSLETFEEFTQQGLMTKVKNEKLKQLLEDLEFMLLRMKNGDDYSLQQYNTLIEPYFAKHINYGKNAHPRFRAGLLPGGPDTDFKALFNDMELWNVATLKLETTNVEARASDRMLELLTDLKLNLEKELNHD